MSQLNKVWFLALLGAFFYWLSLPPLHQPWAAYLCCICWTAIVARGEPLTRRDYWAIWLSSLLCWLALLQGIRLAFWGLYAGWVALSLYLAVYLPLFVGMSRSLHHKFRFALPLAVSVVWVGFELIRGYFATGFSACMLAHSQIPWPGMLQIASHFGGYGVSFVVMFASAIVYQWIAPLFERSKSNTSISDRGNWITRTALSVVAAIVILGSLIYDGYYQSWLSAQLPIKPLCRVLLIQENMPTQFDPSGDSSNAQIGWQRYEQQTSRAARAEGKEPIDLVVWPESAFSGAIPFFDWDKSAGVPVEFDLSATAFENQFSQIQANHQLKLKRIFGPFNDTLPYFLVGTDVYKIRNGKLDRYNAALWIDPEIPESAQYYGKGHLVMFGEYIPIVAWFPQLQSAIGLGQLSKGKEASHWPLKTGAIVSPTVCFEDVVPHLIRSRIIESTKKGSPPDLLINITNDGWFRGSSILNHHLNNGILAAVENRRPVLVCANNGISAWIDGTGRLVASLPALETGYILAEPIPDGRWGLWQSIGDWPAKILAVITLFPVLVWLLSWRKRSART